MGQGGQFYPDSNGATAIDQTPTDRPDAKELAPGREINESTLAGPPGFKLTPENGWTLDAVESRQREEPGAASWSIAIASRDQDHSERLGVFISFDVGQLLNKREWQMSLEQEMAKVRQRARQLLSGRKDGEVRRT